MLVELIKFLRLMGDSKWLINQSSLLPAGLLASPKAKILLQSREPSLRKRRATQGTLPASLPEHALYSMSLSGLVPTLPTRRLLSRGTRGYAKTEKAPFQAG